MMMSLDSSSQQLFFPDGENIRPSDLNAVQPLGDDQPSAKRRRLAAPQYGANSMESDRYMTEGIGETVTPFVFACQPLQDLSELIDKNQLELVEVLTNQLDQMTCINNTLTGIQNTFCGAQNTLDAMHSMLTNMDGMVVNVEGMLTSINGTLVNVEETMNVNLSDISDIQQGYNALICMHFNGLAKQPLDSIKPPPDGGASAPRNFPTSLKTLKAAAALTMTKMENFYGLPHDMSLPQARERMARLLGVHVKDIV